MLGGFQCILSLQATLICCPRCLIFPWTSVAAAVRSFPGSSPKTRPKKQSFWVGLPKTRSKSCIHKQQTERNCAIQSWQDRNKLTLPFPFDIYKLRPTQFVFRPPRAKNKLRFLNGVASRTKFFAHQKIQPQPTKFPSFSMIITLVFNFVCRRFLPPKMPDHHPMTPLF